MAGLISRCFSSLIMKLPDWVLSYLPSSRADFLILGLLFGHSVAENGFLGFLISLLLQHLGVHDLRTSVTIANIQSVISGLLSILMFYFGCFRSSLSRMILYSYSTYIAGMLLLWISPSRSNLFFILVAVLITIGQAGERCVFYFFGVDEWDAPNVMPPDMVVPLRMPIPGERRLHCDCTEVEKREKVKDKRVKLFVGRAPGLLLGASYVSNLSQDHTFRFTALVMVATYHLFFWFGPKSFYTQDLEETKEDGDNTFLRQLMKAIKVSERLVPLWLTFTFTCYLVNATGNTFFYAQVLYLNNKTSLPPSYLYLFVQVVEFLTSLVCDCLINKCICQENRKQWARLIRVGVGMVFSFLCLVVACLVERRRVDSGSNSINVFWLVPQYLLLGLMRGIGTGGLSEFLVENCLPDVNEKRHILAVCAFADGLAKTLSAVFANVSPSRWIGTDIGTSDLYYYYRMLAIMCLCSSFLFIILGITYKSVLQKKRRPVELALDLELARDLEYDPMEQRRNDLLNFLVML